MATTTGLVLAGAVARGAYEAGALSVILPLLEEREESPRILVGTSAGALNACFLASHADLSADVATKALVDLWRSLERTDIFRYSPLAPIVLGLQELGLSLRPRGLVDTSPLEETLNEGVGSWSRIRANIKAGHIDALAIVTTASRTGRTVVFVDGGVVKDGERTSDLPDPDNKRGIDYLHAVDGIGLSHVLASAAMPILFQPIKIELEDGTSDWYFDGGLRLNAPIKPALRLGADRVAIVAADPAWRSPQDSQVCGPLPDVDDYVLHFIQAGLADPLIEDMWTLVGINTLLGEQAAKAGGKTARRKEPDKSPIEYLFVGPRRRGELGCMAGDASRDMGASILKILGWALGRQGSQGHELLSYVLFDPEFFNRAIEHGQEDAQRELSQMKRQRLRWRIDAPKKP